HVGVTGVSVGTGDPSPLARLLAERADAARGARKAALAKDGGACLGAAREPAEQCDVVVAHAAPCSHRASASSVGVPGSASTNPDVGKRLRTAGAACRPSRGIFR